MLPDQAMGHNQPRASRRDRHEADARRLGPADLDHPRPEPDGGGKAGAQMPHLRDDRQGRAQLLARHGLVFRDPRRFYQIATAGLEALGKSSPPPRWIDPIKISAAAGRDVQERGGADNVGDDRPARLRAAHLPLSKIGRPPSAWSEKRLTSERAVRA